MIEASTYEISPSSFYLPNINMSTSIEVANFLLGLFTILRSWSYTNAILSNWMVYCWWIVYENLSFTLKYLQIHTIYFNRTYTLENKIK